MRQTSYTDERGRKWAVWLPDDVPDENASWGIPIGPPPIADHLPYPEPFRTRIHNALFDREIFTAEQARGRLADVAQAIRVAIKPDAITIADLYAQAESGILPDEDTPTGTSI